MPWQRITWPLLAVAAALWVLLSADRAVTQLSRCPEIATVPLLVLAMLVASTSVHAWVWAWLYRRVGAIHGLEASLCFSGITFTTVGYGDITLARCWRLLSVGEAVNGMLMAGWSAAHLILLVQRLMTLRLRSEGRSMD